MFNGEAGLARCLGSLLQQDYPNIEIVISDNGSTDGTRAICEGHAERDSRIRYHRSVENRGFVWNFNRVFDLSSGEYFLWAAHDDTREPGFVSACVEQLQKSSQAVLCQAHTSIAVDGSDAVMCICKMDSFQAATDVRSRYRETLRRFPTTAIYGVYRSSAVRRTLRVRNMIASDLAFIQELSIHGTFIQVPHVLFHYSARPSWNTIHQEARLFLNRNRKPWWYVPFAMLFLDHGTRLVQASIPLGLKISLLSQLLLHQARELMVKVGLKTMGILSPEQRREAVGRALYDRWIRNPNITVVSGDLFFERVCKPQLGWWR